MSKLSNPYIDNAIKGLMTLEVYIPRWDGVAKLKQGGRKAAADVGANQSAARLYVDLLGSHQRKLKKVLAAFAKIRTYLYENTLPLNANGAGQKRGPRILPTVRVPEVYGNLVNLKEEADQELEQFLAQYDELRALAIANDMGGWSSEVSDAYPSTEMVREKFRATIFPPKPLSNAAIDVQNIGLPMGMASSFAQQHYDMLDHQLQAALEAAVTAARDQMATVQKQLTSGERLHESLITNSKRAATMLRDMAQAYNNDPRLLSIADEISDKIASVPSTEHWKTSSKVKGESLKAATAMQKALKGYSPATAPKPQAKPQATPKKKSGTVKVGGIMGKKTKS